MAIRATDEVKRIAELHGLTRNQLVDLVVASIVSGQNLKAEEFFNTGANHFVEEKS